MASKQYHLGFSAKQKASLKNQVRRRKPSDNESETSDVVKQSNPYKDDSYVTIKTEMLGRKLKKKDNKSTMQFSRLTFLKQSRSLNGFRITSSDKILTTLKEEKSQIIEDREMSVQILQQNLSKMTQKHRQILQKFNYVKNENSVEMSQILRLIDQLQERNRSYDVNKYTFNIYWDILSRYNKENTQMINKMYSKRSNINHSYKEPSLLQSFKRNLEDEDGYVTLKYSQQSNRKERSQPNQTLAQGWDSFRKDNLKNTLFKSANKGQVEKYEIQQDQFGSIKDSLVQHLYYQKSYLVNEHNQSQKILHQFEGVLQKIIEEVAYEKVEQDQLLKDFETMRNEDYLEISSIISKMKMEQMAQRFRFEQKVNQIQESLNESLAQEKYVRKSQQKSMIKMMIQVVEFFN